MTEQEEFRPIAGYEGKYEVSNYGRVKSLPRPRVFGRFLGGLMNTGYVRANLQNDDMTVSARLVHQLVAIAFISKPESELPLCVNHKDGVKTNNHVSNLEWVTHYENAQHAHRTGLINKVGEGHPLANLTDSQVIEIREMYKTASRATIAKHYGVKVGTISSIVTGARWKHLPLCEYVGWKAKRAKQP